MSLSNFIKNILNIQDNNISFPEDDYCQTIKKSNFLIKVFKGFLKDDYCSCPHCNSKNIVKNGDRKHNIKFVPFQSYNIELNLSVQRYICMDIYSPYISLVNSIFPSAKIILDKFHIVNLVNRAFNQTRIAIMNSLDDDSLKRKFKLFWKLPLKYYSNLCNKAYYCQSFKRKLSSKDKVDYLLEKSLELDVNFNIYQDILQSIKHNNFKRFEDIVKRNLTKKEKVSKKMLIALKTLKKYMKYIKNMFESNITNGVIEGINNKIKSIKRTAFGYSNFSNFKKRILIQAGIISISA